MALNNPYANHSTHANEFKLTDNIRRSTSISPPFDDNFHLSNPHLATNHNIQLNLTDNNYFSPISSDIQSSLVNPNATKFNQSSHEQQLEYNGSFVSHIPMMSSSSSNSSLPQQQSNLQDNLDDPRIRPIVTGQETLIEIDREQAGLGLSVVGGSDTQLVNPNDELLVQN